MSIKAATTRVEGRQVDGGTKETKLAAYLLPRFCGCLEEEYQCGWTVVRARYHDDQALIVPIVL